jgi:hypothetical protein
MALRGYGSLVSGGTCRPDELSHGSGERDLSAGQAGRAEDGDVVWSPVECSGGGVPDYGCGREPAPRAVPQ